jgi:hypothetical protein
MDAQAKAIGIRAASLIGSLGALYDPRRRQFHLVRPWHTVSDPIIKTKNRRTNATTTTRAPRPIGEADMMPAHFIRLPLGKAELAARLAAAYTVGHLSADLGEIRDAFNRYQSRTAKVDPRSVEGEEFLAAGGWTLDEIPGEPSAVQLIAEARKDARAHYVATRTPSGRWAYAAAVRPSAGYADAREFVDNAGEQIARDWAETHPTRPFAHIVIEYLERIAFTQRHGHASDDARALDAMPRRYAEAPEPDAWRIRRDGE